MTDKETFKNIVESYPNISSYICFARLIKNKNFNRAKVTRLMNELVDKKDYSSSDKTFLLDQLMEYSKISPK